MATNEERLKIMKLIQDGKINAEEAMELLEALENPKNSPSETPSMHQPGGPGRWFRVKVTDAHTGKSRANIRLPIGLVNAGLKMGAKFSPEMDGVDMNVLKDAVLNNKTGLIIDVFDDQDDEHVEIFIEE
jgi:hypothetical protein